MRPPLWQPPVEPSVAEQAILTRIRRAKLFVFLRHQRHQLLTDAFQAELAATYQAGEPVRAAAHPTGATGAGHHPAGVHRRLRR